MQTTFVDSTNICVDFLFVNLNYHKLIFKFPYFSGAYKTSYKYIGKREKSVIFNTVIYQSNNKHAKVRYKISISIDHIWAHVAFFLFDLLNGILQQHAYGQFANINIMMMINYLTSLLNHQIFSIKGEILHWLYVCE